MQNTLEALLAEAAAKVRPLCTYGGAKAPELAFVELLQAAGGTPANSGWPDFAVFGKDNRPKAVVEVRPEKGRWKPRPEQVVMLTGLASFGLPCFIWSPAGLFKVSQDRTAPPVSMDTLTGLL